MEIPESFSDESQLDAHLSTPSPALIRDIRQVRSPLIILGAGGKMGPTIAAMALKAARSAGHPLRVIAVSRFSNADAARWLQENGVETRDADLLDRAAVARLPDAGDVLYLVGRKFGTADSPSLTWAVNAVAPTFAVERFKGRRFVALSTGNVYPLVPVSNGGADENHPRTPQGEYANAALARERMFEFWSANTSTPVALLRLNYAVETRYGVLVDIGRKVHAGQAVDLTMGHFNCIWQRDASDLILRSFPLASVPLSAWNLTGTATESVRTTAEAFAELFGRPAIFTGSEAPTALLSNSTRLSQMLGQPATGTASMVRAIASWIAANGRSLDRPTHFEVRSGVY